MYQSRRLPLASWIPAFVSVVAMVTMTCQQTVQAKCVPTKTKPDLDKIQVKNFASSYRGTVANLAGYLELVNSTGPSSYLPLDFESMSVSTPDDMFVRTITFSNDCLNIGIGYSIGSTPNPSDYTFKFTGMEMYFKDDSDSWSNICEFDQSFDLSLPDNFRYSCTKVMSHQCSFGKRAVAQLVLKSFEIDFDGYPANVKRGTFTEEPWDESCEHWNK